ncbi:MAG: LysR family transcriptional regulator [Chitinophagaceae bacterium]|nr:LysR family transcriptional regulator [Chitinophagaceae bacterium]
MTLTQIEYIVAVEKHGSFVTAAENCFVTQPTLSMQIQKLEEELGLKIFDRNHHPIIATKLGKKIIEQSKLVLFEKKKIDELLLDDRNELSGHLNIGVIPTVASSIIPNTLRSFAQKFPNLIISIQEMTTQRIVDKLKEDEIDFGIASTPLGEKSLKETKLYQEPFIVFAHEKNPLLKKKLINPKELDVNQMWSLSDEHCMKNQVMHLCGKQKVQGSKTPLNYLSGSVMSLINMVRINGGFTIIPILFEKDFSGFLKNNTIAFEEPVPCRQISMLTNKYFTKNKIANAFKASILEFIPKEMLAEDAKRKIMPI